MSACCHRPSVNRAVLIQQVASCVAVILALYLIKMMKVLVMVSIVVCINQGHNYGKTVKSLSVVVGGGSLHLQVRYKNKTKKRFGRETLLF